MTRAAHLIPKIERLASEVALVYKELVLPLWLSPHHGLTRHTLRVRDGSVFENRLDFSLLARNIRNPD